MRRLSAAYRPGTCMRERRRVQDERMADMMDETVPGWRCIIGGGQVVNGRGDALELTADERT